MQVKQCIFWIISDFSQVNNILDYLRRIIIGWKNTAKLHGDALVWSAVFIEWLDLFELIYELIGLTCSFDFLTKWILFIWLIDWMNEWIQYIISEDVCPISCISWLQISWDISPELLYLIAADFSWDITPDPQYQISWDVTL